MEFRILGTLEVVDDAGAVVDLPVGRARALLAVLVVQAGQVVATDRLVTDLWGEDPPATARTGLHVLVSRLRSCLEPDREPHEQPRLLVTRSSGYMLDVDDDQVDARRFEELVAAADGLPPAGQASGLRQALALWRGPPLSDVADQPFARPTIVALQAARLRALERRVGADLALGRQAALVGELEGLVAQHPHREALVGHLMVALARTGRASEAVAVYEQAREQLRDGLDVEPGVALQRLARDLRTGRRTVATDVGSTDPGAPGSIPRPLDHAVGHPVRKFVTIACVDLATGQDGALDPEARWRVVRRRVTLAREVLERRRGRVQGVLGDVLVAMFGIPTIHEDDAEQAVLAATELRDAIHDLDTDPGAAPVATATAAHVRIGVSTGEVVVGDVLAVGASGDVVSRAVRLQELADAGDVLVDAGTRELAAQRVDLVRFDLPEAVDASMSAWRVVAPHAPGDHHRESTFVGRTRELDRLQVALAGVRRRHEAAGLLVVGEAGIGKTRLATEFAERVDDDVRVLVARCRARAVGQTFGPLRELLVAASGSDEASGPARLVAELAEPPAAAAVARAVGLPLPDGVDPAPLPPSVGGLFESLASRVPLLVVSDDVHWGQSTFLDLLDYLGEHVAAPVLFVALARPEFLDRRPDWATGGDGWATMMLDPLDGTDTLALATDVLARRLATVEGVERVVSAAGGNPLFLEQLLATFEPGVGEVTVPPSLQALLAARVDQLPDGDRQVLRAAAVVGEDVPDAALRAVLQDSGPAPRKALRRLVERRLVRPWRQRGRVIGHRFVHALVRDAAYASITHEERANQHERLATWTAESASPFAGFGAADDRDASTGHHLERAATERRLAGIDDEHAAELARRAGERLAAAGRRAWQRFDLVAVDDLLGRARELLPDGHPERGRVSRALLDALQPLGRHRDAEAILTQLLEPVPTLAQLLHRAPGPGEPAAVDRDWSQQLRLRVEQDRLRVFLGPGPARLDDIVERVSRAMDAAVGANDHAGVAQAAHVLTECHLRRGDVAAISAVTRIGLAHARRADDPRALAAMLWMDLVPDVVGPTPVPAAIEHGRTLLPWVGVVHPGVLADLGLLSAMLGDVEEGRQHLADSRRLFREHFGGRRPLMFVAVRRAALEALADDLEAAERWLRSGLGRAREMGEADQVAEIAATLALVLVDRGRVQEAQPLVGLAGKHVQRPSVVAESRLLSARARMSAVRGQADEAGALADRAVGLVPRDMPSLRGDCRWQQARVRAELGDVDRALEAATAAAELYDRKDHVLGAERARVLAEELATRGGSRPGA